jgi:hypothetical protein
LESDPATRLTREQIARILPYVKALKDIPAGDTQAVDAIVLAVVGTFTPPQRAALDAARQRFAARQGTSGAQAGGRNRGPNAQDGAPGGQGIGEEQRQQFRTLAFGRMIRYLEQRMR